MPIFGWIRDALGIHKDNVEIDKAEREIKKLEDEEVARHLITPATMENIREYDPKWDAIERHISEEKRVMQSRWHRRIEWLFSLSASIFWGLAVLIVLAFLSLVYLLLRWIIG